MSKIVIIGAGAMGTAFALPCLDNNHNINIVGTHLENDFIDDLKKNDNLHPGLKTKIPKEIKITVEKQTIIKINGVDKELVSKIAADIKNLKPVEPYKAKGIKERGQFVLRKEGKKK